MGRQWLKESPREISLGRIVVIAAVAWGALFALDLTIGITTGSLLLRAVGNVLEVLVAMLGLALSERFLHRRRRRDTTIQTLGLEQAKEQRDAVVSRTPSSTANQGGSRFGLRT